MDVVDEQIDATTQAFLGLTVACARCHDHKFDPIPQRDYYALAGIFRSTADLLRHDPASSRTSTPAPLIELPPDAGQPAGVAAADARAAGRDGGADRAALASERDAVRQDEASSRPAPADRLEHPLAMLQSQLDSLSTADGTPKPFAMGVRERDRAGRQPALRPRRARTSPARSSRAGLPQVLGRRAGRAIAAGSGRLRAGRLARVAGQSADGPRDGQSRLAAPVRPRARADAGQLRRQRPAADATRSCSTPGRPVHGRRLVGQEADPPDRAEPGLPARRRAYDARNYEADPDNALVWRMSQAAAGGRGAARRDARGGRRARCGPAGRVAGGAGRRRAVGR